MYSIKYLFSDSDLRNFLQERMNTVIKEIKTQDKNYILNVSQQDYVNYLIEKYTLETPLLLEDKITLSHTEIEVDVSRNFILNIRGHDEPVYKTGTEYTLSIPFNGDMVLFNYKPSTYYLSSPEGIVRNQVLSVSVKGVELKAADVKAKLDDKLKVIKEWLDFVRKDIESFNLTLSQEVGTQVISRKDKLLKDDNLASELGYPLRVIDGIPNTFSIPAKRNNISFKPSASTHPFKPEPTLSMENYEHILTVVKNMTLVMERSPNAFKNMKEEDLRQHFLVQLNGHYEGEATGETFNYQGKTDILIRHEGKNVFIAECKFWKGQGVFKETIDQILKYLSWRDTKTAIFLFNRNKDFSQVLSQIPNIAKEHPNFKSEVKFPCETGFRFIFHHNDDKNRELFLTILVFEVPT